MCRAKRADVVDVMATDARVVADELAEEKVREAANEEDEDCSGNAEVVAGGALLKIVSLIPEIVQDSHN